MAWIHCGLDQLWTWQLNNSKLNICILFRRYVCSIWFCSIYNLFCSVDFLFKWEIVQNSYVEISFVQYILVVGQLGFCSINVGQLTGGNRPLATRRTTIFSWTDFCNEQSIVTVLCCVVLRRLQTSEKEHGSWNSAFVTALHNIRWHNLRR